MTTAVRRLGLITARTRRLMTDAATVNRKTEAPDGSGGTTTSVTALGPFPVRLEAKQAVPLERAEGGRIVAMTVWTAYLPSGTDVLPADELVINSETFEVVDHDDTATDAAFMAVSLRRVQ